MNKIADMSKFCKICNLLNEHIISYNKRLQNAKKQFFKNKNINAFICLKVLAF